MTKYQTLYLTPQQVEGLRKLDLFDGTHSIQIHQADLLDGGEHAGHLIIQESMGSDGIRLDRQGNIVQSVGR
jgi:hypothetical protein